MGKLTKYLKQTAVIENVVLGTDGKPQLDAYGQPSFGTPTTVKCRKEPYRVRATTGYGQFVNFTTTYYFDESVQIRSGDIVDGHEVQSIADYVDGLGNLVGYQVDV